MDCHHHHHHHCYYFASILNKRLSHRSWPSLFYNRKLLRSYLIGRCIEKLVSSMMRLIININSCWFRYAYKQSEHYYWCEKLRSRLWLNLLFYSYVMKHLYYPRGKGEIGSKISRHASLCFWSASPLLRLQNKHVVHQFNGGRYVARWLFRSWVSRCVAGAWKSVQLERSELTCWREVIADYGRWKSVKIS